jgi:hypothetical protein
VFAALIVAAILPAEPAVAWQCSITVDGILGGWVDGGQWKLQPGAVNKIQLRYKVLCAGASYRYNPINSFLIFSPQNMGAVDWGYVTGQTYADWASFGWGGSFVNHFDKSGGSGTWVPATGGSCDGNDSGRDSAGVQFAAFSTSLYNGLPGQYNGVPVGIALFPPSTAEGGYICIDTAHGLPGSPIGWEWRCVDINQPTRIPSWHSTRQCFEVKSQSNSVTVTGQVSYYDWETRAARVVPEIDVWLEFTGTEADFDTTVQTNAAGIYAVTVEGDYDQCQAAVTLRRRQRRVVQRRCHRHALAGAGSYQCRW